MNDYKNILIIGAGIAGRLLEKDIAKNQTKCKIVGFVDDEMEKSKRLNILGDIDNLSKINKIYKVDEMVISIPSASGSLVRRIVLNNLKNRVPIKIVPREQKTINYNYVKYENLSDLSCEDLLGRPFEKSNTTSLAKFYQGKKIFITGGAGSIGSEIVRQVLDLGAKKVIIYDNSEYLIFNLDQNLKEREISKKRYELVIGNILNHNKVDHIIRKEKPDMVFHAAAYKHVYLMEENIDEAIRNNILGTKNVVNSSISNGVKHFVFISTDKVVNPTSVMGATKKLCEYYIKSLNNKKTKFSIVRFGNVMNSNGSVLPFFERQIRENRYVTVTHKKIQRFFMSIKEAAHLVVTSASNDSRGDINILDMGELINIHEIAQCLIRSKNLIIGEDVEIKIIGLKKGEKLIEELFTESEKNNLIKTKTRGVFRLKNFEKCDRDINHLLKDLVEIASNFPGRKKIRNYLKDIFPTLKT